MLDDLHWADEPSLELLDALLRRPARGRVLLAGAYRPKQAPRWLTEALASQPVRVELAPLELAQARALLGDGLDDETLEALHTESGGVPFYLEELARAPRAAHGAPGLGGVPAAVALALQAEIDGLPRLAAELLRGAAVAGDPFEVGLAAEAAGLPERDALPALDELVALDLVRGTATARRFRFRHPLVRHAVYESASPGFRIAAHERAAAALERAGAGALARARHVAASAGMGDDGAVAVLVDAAHGAMARAPVVAAHWFGEALRLLGEQPAWRLNLLVARAWALVAAGRLEPGLEVLHEALSRVPVQDTALRVHLLGYAARADTLLGRAAQARGRLEAELAALSDHDAANAAHLHFELALIAVWSARLADVLTHSHAAFEAGRAAGDAALETAAEALNGFGEIGRSDHARAAAAVQRAGRRFDGLSDDALAGRMEVAGLLAYVAIYIDNFDDALRWMQRGTAVARRTGQGQVLVQLLSGQAIVLAVLGRLAAADELADAAWEAARLDPNEVARSWALRTRCFVSLQKGDLPAATAAAEAFATLARTFGYDQTGPGAGALVGEALLEAGEPARAAAVVLELGGGDDLSLNFPSGRCAGYDVLARAELAAGRLDEADRWAGRAQAVADGFGVARVVALASSTRARVLLASGDPAGAARLALEAVASARGVGARIDAARAQILAGRALAAAGDRQAAVVELERAEAELAGCGARRARDEAAQELRALGLRVARRPETGAELNVLSRRELEVAELVALGRTSKEIATTLHISVNTVDSHLKRIFAKLGVPNRAAVAAALERERRGAGA